MNRNAVGAVALGAAAVIGLGVAGIARAADATSTTPTPTTQSQSSGDGGTSTAPGEGRGWGPGGRHGMGGMGLGADLTQLATNLGVDEAKLRDALKTVRDQLKAEHQAGRGTPGTPPTAADRAAMQTELATKLAAALGVDEAKVQTALTELRAAHEAERQKAFDDRLAKAVTDGKLTQAEADAVKKAAQEGVIGMGGGPR
ncbi:hypothetical protein N865_15470 [Intrasporangium oryzae NRRL B-24470]|uniref:Uncharacterized protein n=1 Tax=Intrasporangium oryzae NRRL B-24470 TaxID=1386089 RepID=W9G6L1_9MICO|nr:Clp protease N-terminal domain-containing protein [Intrasporangium oryzae]EWT00448.1 hypothetical protein N865_15470 [Intrasporangium oryzae NRRL B-24470]